MTPRDPEAGTSRASASAGRELPALQQVRESAQALLRDGKTEETWEFLLSALEAVLLKSQELELLVAKLRRASRGTTSERIDPAQLQLLFEELIRQSGESEKPDPEAEAKEDAALTAEIEAAEQAQPDEERKKRKAGAGWQTRGVERRTHKRELPKAERACEVCGQLMNRIGEDVTRRLEYVPGHFIEHEHRLEKYGCGTCKEGVATAPAPPQVLKRSAADASLLAHVAVSKFDNHIPLHRLSKIYAQDGADIPVSTLCDWVAGSGDLVEPLVDCLEQRVMGAHVVATDATGLKVLDPTHPDNIVRGTIWVRVGDERDVVFRYTKTGEGEDGPWKLLAGRKGYIQADASNVFDRLFNGKVASAIELGCWSHARRQIEALKETDFRVAWPLKLIARLYRFEHLADARRLSHEERAAFRAERSVPVLEKLKRWFVSTSATEPPRSALAKAAAYPVNHWDALTRFVSDGRLKLDNNISEQQLRGIALGRHNYLFAGSHDAARRAANLYSLVRTCAQHGVPPLPYLTDVLGKLGAGWDPNRLEELLPHRWRAPGTSPPSTQDP